jgi:hypothetical protein
MSDRIGDLADHLLAIFTVRHDAETMSLPSGDQNENAAPSVPATRDALTDPSARSQLADLPDESRGVKAMVRSSGEIVGDSGTIIVSSGGCMLS